jgi:hypothetical protein
MLLLICRLLVKIFLALPLRVKMRLWLRRQLMIVWRWDREITKWQEVLLHKGEPLQITERALLLPQRGNRCLLICTRSIEVNGETALPVRYLSHQDEINLGDEVVHFSVESPIEVVSFAVQEKEIACGRCKGTLQQADPVVQCPQCEVWHHQSQALDCWEHDECCSSCKQTTSGISWQPEAPAYSASTRVAL